MAGDAPAAIAWSGSAEDRRALALRSDWSDLRSLEQLWPVLAERYGDSLALDAPHARPPQRFSYRELQRAIEQAAAGFAALGIGAGDVVALFAENSPRWLVADQALMRLGAADAVRGSGAPIEELRYIAADSGAVALVLESAELLQQLNLSGPLLAQLRCVVLLQGEAAASPPGLLCITWDELMARGATAPPPPLPEGGEQRLATVLYTSGTTGEPKGVPLSHANLLHQLRTLGVAVQPDPGERVLSVLPIWHAYERSAEYFLLSRGCTQTYTTLRQLRADLQKVRPQYLISVPRLWEALMAGFEEALAAMPAARRRLLTAALANSRAWSLARRTALDLTLSHETLPRRLGAALETLLRWPLHGLASALLWPKVRQQLVGGCLQRAISGGGCPALA